MAGVHKKTSKREKRVKIDTRERQTEDRKTRMHIFFVCVRERERERERERKVLERVSKRLENVKNKLKRQTGAKID